jgi:acyl dehydratase
MDGPPGTNVVRCNPHRYADRMNRLYLDDLTVGQRFTSGTRTLDAAEMQRFAADHDPQPFHLDDAAARDTLFGGLVASGWHTACTTMRLIVDGGLPIAGGIIGTGGELLWTRPVRPDDTLHVECEILEIAPSRSKPDRGTVTVRCVTLNQNDEMVQSFTPKLVVPRRPPVPSAPTGGR